MVLHTQKWLMFASVAFTVMGFTHARAAIIQFTDRSTFNAASKNLAMVDFEGLAPPGGFVSFGNPGLLVVGDITLASNGPLFVQNDGVNSRLTFQQAPSTNILTIALPEGITAVGADFIAGDPTSVTLSSGESFNIGISPFPTYSFRGFTSDGPISSIQFSNPFGADLDNVTLGQAIPEPSSFLLIALALPGLAVWGWRRIMPRGLKPAMVLNLCIAGFCFLLVGTNNSALAATFTLAPIADGMAAGTNGAFALVPLDTDLGLPLLRVQDGITSPNPTEFRSALEFDLSALPVNAQVMSALLTVPWEEAQGLGDFTPTIEIHGFQGSGTISAADMTVNHLVVGPLTYTVDDIQLSSSGFNNLDVTPFIQSNVNSHFVGFSLRATSLPFLSYWFESIESASHFPYSAPLSLVVTTVPEPGSLILIGFAIAGLVACARFRNIGINRQR